MTYLPARRDLFVRLHAYLDGELDPADALALETRMAHDFALAAELARLKALQQAIRGALPREAEPLRLRAAVEVAVGLRRRAELRGALSWHALAAAVALAAVLASGATVTMVASSRIGQVRDAVVAGHIRALLAPRPFDVAASNERVVKPWFDRKLSQVPRVVDLAGAGFPLLGGRLDVVGASAVPTLVYRYRTHLISVTVVPVSTGQALAPVHSEVGGYSVTRWIENDECYWVVSDAAAADLDRLAALFRAADAE